MHLLRQKNTNLNDLLLHTKTPNLQIKSKTGSAFGTWVKITRIKKQIKTGTNPTYKRLVCFISNKNASIRIHSGTVKLKAKVANRDEVRKQPLKKKRK